MPTGQTIRRKTLRYSTAYASGLRVTYKGYAVIRTINQRIFTIFGLGGQLRYERDKAAARTRKKERKSLSSAKAKIDLAIDSSIQHRCFAR